MRVLLDTCAYTALRQGSPALADRVRRSEKVILSTVVMGELMFGFRLGTRFEKNMREMEGMLENPHVVLLPVTRVTAERFGRIAALLRKRGTPIPTNDIWIAAHAMESGAELLSFDHHFEQVEGLAWVPLAGG